jgi:hypothetical protein
METEMQNLKFVECQPRWRVGIVALFAKLMGVLIHVEGIPMGSGRSRKKQAPGQMGGAASPSQAAGGQGAQV